MARRRGRPRVLIYKHELKLLFFSASSLAALHLIYWMYHPKGLMLFLAITAIAVAVPLLSRLYLEGYEPGRYLTAFYWAYFVAAFFLKDGIGMSIMGLPKEAEGAMWIAVYSAIIAAIARLRARQGRNSLIPTSHLLLATVLYTTILYWTPSPLINVLLPFLAFSFLSSFVAVRLGRRLYINLSVVGLVASAVFLSLPGIVKSSPLFLLYLTLFSLAYYFAAMKAVKSPLAAGVAISLVPIALFPFLVVLTWTLLTGINIIPQTPFYPFAVFLPATVAGVLMDVIKGMRLQGPIVVGALGMADALWFIWAVTYVFYIALLKEGLLGFFIYIFLIFFAYVIFRTFREYEAITAYLDMLFGDAK